ncbi:MAG: VIT1/CCC1 family protein [Coriobacteriales bacterium]|jgi:VIT1/CCC1 family predicted Fe2+/Mn2+ transporter|nr:VIT1/CCC1 family protein [Coriobacteriales bacterium]
MTPPIDEGVRTALIAFQRAEASDAVVYRRMARHERHDPHRAIFNRIAEDELAHYDVLKRYTGVDVPPSRLKVCWYTLLLYLLGYTFVLRLMEKSEDRTAAAYGARAAAISETEMIIAHEQEHESALAGILDEERLHYVGSVVLGLSDALVELTGAIAGLTFALANARIVALAGIITGIAATLSMAASNYLAKRAEGDSHALRASLYTGMAYLVTVAILVTPYLLVPPEHYQLAFVIMLGSVVVVIAAFNYYLSVAEREPFFSRFGHMTAISLSVAAISFVIGLAARALLGVDL